MALPASLLCGWQYANGLNRKLSAAEKQAAKAQAQEIMNDDDLIKADPTKPSAGLILALIALPIALIIINSICSVLLPAENLLAMFFAFVGNNNVALFIAMLVTGIVLHKYLVPKVSESIWKYIDKASDSMGNILMVIGCGNCFGAILQKSGLGDALVTTLSQFNIPVVLLAFLLAMIIRAAVGSATVAMLTTVSIVGPSAVAMGFSPVIVGLAICAGTVGLTLPTDAAFWLPARYNDLSVSDAFQATTWSTTLASVAAFAMILLLNLFSGVLPGMF